MRCDIRQSINWGDGTEAALAIESVPFGPPGSLAGLLGTLHGSHVYADNGDYAVTFTLTDDDGGVATETLTMSILIANDPAVAEAGAGATISEGGEFSLSGASFTDRGTLDTHTAGIDWDDGTTTAGLVTETPFGPPSSTAGMSGAVAASHVYADDGECKPVLTVTDDDEESGADSVLVTVLNVAPTVDAGSDLAAFEGDAVLVTATFTDPGVLDSHTAQINWGDGVITAGAVDALTKTVSGMHVYADNGPYLVELTVTDDDGDSGSDSLTVSVANVAPVVLTGDPLTEEEGVAFDLPPTFFTDAGSADTHTATVDFGDGTIVPGTIDVATGRISASHTYGDNGEFVITVAVTDDDGDTGSGTWLVTVDNMAPAMSDFDGDGKSDILWRNVATGENYLYPMDGLGIKSTEGSVRTVADLNWQVAGIGDFDGDGRADVLWRNSSTGENYMYLMNGTAIAGEGYIRTVVDQAWQVAGVGDFEGDGKADVLWRNSSTGENYMYLMNGTAIAGEGYIRAVVDQAWQVAGVGDFEGDGRADILWRNSSTGENYLYFMDGINIKPTEGFTRTVADLNWQVAGAAAPAYQADTLFGAEQTRVAQDAQVFTAAASASDAVEVGSFESQRLPDLAQLVASSNDQDVREPIDDLAEHGLKLFGHTSGNPALFSVDGVTLGEDGDVRHSGRHELLHEHGLTDWTRDGGKRTGDAQHAEDNRSRGEHHAEAKRAAAKSIDWNDSFRGLGAGMAATPLGGNRGAQQPNLAGFDLQQKTDKKPRR